jgi:hypothetical protein
LKYDKRKETKDISLVFNYRTKRRKKWAEKLNVSKERVRKKWSISESESSQIGLDHERNASS